MILSGIENKIRKFKMFNFQKERIRIKKEVYLRMVKIFLEFMENKNIRVQEVQYVLNKINIIRFIFRYVVVKLQSMI